MARSNVCVPPKAEPNRVVGFDLGGLPRGLTFRLAQTFGCPNEPYEAMLAADRTAVSLPLGKRELGCVAH
jgi:hypothetical protein